jgi:hypothetical protein
MRTKQKTNPHWTCMCRMQLSIFHVSSIVDRLVLDAFIVRIYFLVFVYREVQSMITPDDSTPSPQYTHLLTLIQSIRQKTNELELTWEKRRIRAELFVQLKHFELQSRDVSQRDSDYFMIDTSFAVESGRLSIFVR